MPSFTESLMSEAYIVAATRNAGGRKNGRLSGWHPADLLGQVINGVLDRSGIDPVAVEDVIAGGVGQVGEQAVNVGRNGVLAYRLTDTTLGTTGGRPGDSAQHAPTL